MLRMEPGPKRFRGTVRSLGHTLATYKNNAKAFAKIINISSHSRLQLRSLWHLWASMIPRGPMSPVQYVPVGANGPERRGHYEIWEHHLILWSIAVPCCILQSFKNILPNYVNTSGPPWTHMNPCDKGWGPSTELTV